MTYDILTVGQPVAGRVDLAAGVPSSPISGRITVVETREVVPTPEPGTMALACAALPLLGLGYMRGRRRQSAS